MSSDNNGFHYPERKTPQVISTYSRPEEGHDQHEGLSQDEILRRSDKACQKKRREQIAAGRDEKFKMKVFWVVLATLVVCDYLYLPILAPGLQLPWWGHTAIVVPVTFLVVVLTMQLRLIRPLRRIITFVVFVALGLGVFLWLDLIPHAV